MSSSYHSEDDAIVDINMTPFVDVVLVLLVIFMVAQRAIVARGVDVQKPAAAAGTSGPVTLRVSVDAAGQLFVAGTLVAAPEASAKIAEAVRGQNEPSVIIAGDGRAAYAGVMRAIDAAQTAGVTAIKLENVPLSP